MEEKTLTNDMFMTIVVSGTAWVINNVYELKNSLLMDGDDDCYYFIDADGTKRNRNDISDITFGDKWDITEIGDNFFANCKMLDGGIFVPYGVEKIGNGFLRNCENLQTTIVIPDTVRIIGDDFMRDCIHFNANAHIGTMKLRRIGNNFMRNCIRFNRKPFSGEELNAIIIGDNFMYDCIMFNETLPPFVSVRKIGNGFMSGCKSFNNRLLFGNRLETIGDKFMHGCLHFNQPLDLRSDELVQIGDNFLLYCERFNKEIIFPDYIDTIGISFMGGCRNMESPMTLPVCQRVGSQFMIGCEKFCGPLTFHGSINAFRNASAQAFVNTKIDCKAFADGVTIILPLREKILDAKMIFKSIPKGCYRKLRISYKDMGEFESAYSYRINNPRGKGINNNIILITDTEESENVEEE